MKRKLALVLAGVMALTMLPIANVFAATGNSLSNLPAGLQNGKNTFFVEEPQYLQGDEWGDYTVPTGQNLVIKYGTDMKAGSQIVLDLANAEWAFDNTDKARTTWNSNNGFFSGGSTLMDSTTGTALVTSLGIPANLAVSSNMYVRDSALTFVGGRAELPYVMRISPVNKSSATLQLLADFTTDNDVIVVPVIAKANGSADATITVGGAYATPGTLTFGIVNSGVTVTTIKDQRTGTSSLDDLTLMISEARPNTLGGGWFSILAPENTWFVSRVQQPSGVQFMTVDAIGGLMGLQTGVYVNDTRYSQATQQMKFAGISADGRALRVWLDPTVFTNNTSSRNAAGTITIAGIDLILDSRDFTDGDEIGFDIKKGYYVDGDSEANATDVASNVAPASKDTKVNLTEESFKAGTFVTRGINIIPNDTVLTYVTGSFDGNGTNDNYGIADFGSDSFRVKEATIAETSVGSWASRRTTQVVLPEGVKFRAIKITDNDGGNVIGVEKDKVLYSDKKEGEVSTIAAGVGMELTEDALTFRGINVNTNTKGKIKFEAVLSIDASYEGDVTYTLVASGEEDQTVTVGNTKQPFTIDFDNNAHTMTITENYVGALKKDKQLYVSISDKKGDRLFLEKNTTAEEVTDALKLSVNLNTDATSRAISGAYQYSGRTSGAALFQQFLELHTTKESTDKTGPATILISNLPIIDASQYAYATVAGPAIANNYEYLYSEGNRLNSMFLNPGWEQSVGAAEGTVAVVNTSVFTIGQSTYAKGGESIDMDATPYISPEGNTMIPVRFVANALGFADDQILWNASTKTVSFVNTNRTASITQDSSDAIIDGTPAILLDINGNPVTAVNTNDRLYLPVRAISNLFSVPVVWDADAQTVTIN